FADNLIWMLHDGREALVVDPGAASPVAAALEEHGLRLGAILVTHHHADHVGGLEELQPLLQGPVWGPAHEKMPVDVRGFEEGACFGVLGLQAGVLDAPGHTAGHIAYVVREAGKAPWLFCGDTLFSGGCGRLFEVTPAQMVDSLAKLESLPADTR